MTIMEVHSSEQRETDEEESSPTVNIENLAEGLSQEPLGGDGGNDESQDGNRPSGQYLHHGDDDDDDDEDDDDDDMTVIILEQGMDNGDNVPAVWDQDSPEMQERRRNVLLRELQRVQRASFIHFMILCLIPTSLLFIVIATVLGEEEDCESAATTCAKEPRTFINAFTTRCVCDAITVMQGSNP